MTSPEAPFWKEAINSEVESILSNHTWKLVDLPPVNKPLHCKWIFKRKMKADGFKINECDKCVYVKQT